MCPALCVPVAAAYVPSGLQAKTGRHVAWHCSISDPRPRWMYSMGPALLPPLVPFTHPLGRDKQAKHRWVLHRRFGEWSHGSWTDDWEEARHGGHTPARVSHRLWCLVVGEKHDMHIVRTYVHAQLLSHKKKKNMSQGGVALIRE